MKRHFDRKRCRIAGAVVLLLLLGTLLLVGVAVWERHHYSVNDGPDDASGDGQIYFDGVYYKPKRDLESVLVIGVDKYANSSLTGQYNNTEQADFLALLLIDRRAERYAVLHLNRDTMTEIQMLGVRGEKAGTFTGQLALSHTYGSGGNDSCRNTVSAVEGLLYGVQIDHYMSLTMDAVARINDAVGGVTLTMTDDLTGIDPAMIEGAALTLDGEMALRYVRARGGLENSTNLARMERQRQYLEALVEKLFGAAAADDAFFLRLMDTIADYVVSDCTANQLSRLYDQLENYTNDGFIAIAGEAAQGNEFVEFYVDEDALKRLVVTLFYDPVEGKTAA